MTTVSPSRCVFSLFFNLGQCVVLRDAVNRGIGRYEIKNLMIQIIQYIELFEEIPIILG